jgi:hemolysin III
MFCFIWIAAIVGTIFSFVKLKQHSHFETICYVLMGLTVVVAFGPLWNSAGPIATYWIIAEGVMYITGAVFYALYKKPYLHTVFHVFVLLGSICHIIAVWDVLTQFLVGK